MEDAENKIPVRILLDGEAIFTSFFYSEGLPKLDFDDVVASKELLMEVGTDVIINENNRVIKSKRKTPVQIFRNPILRAKRYFVLDGNRPEPLYPPSTKGWLSRVDKTGNEVFMFIHGIKDDQKLWLSVVDRNNSQIYEAHPILPFESGVLELSDEFEEYASTFGSLRSFNRAEKWMENILEGAPPSWNDLARIVEDIYVPNLRIGKNMRETMEQLVPASYSRNIRKQIMAFLALIADWKIPDEDPVQYFDRIYPLDVLYTLLMGYVLSLLSEDRVPSYVRIIQESAQSHLAVGSRPMRSSSREDPWILAQHKIMEETSYGVQTSLRYSSRLNEAGDIVVGLPISEAQAGLNPEFWEDRFLLMATAFRLVTTLRPKALGLVRLIDTTRAHQWPHKHMKWSLNVGGGEYREMQIQMMEMPPAAADRVTRLRPNVVEVEWSKHRINADLYAGKKNQWRIPMGRIIGSLKGRKTIRKLKNEFGAWNGKNVHSPTLEWVRCLDATSNLGYLADLEQSDYLEQIGLTLDGLSSSLNELKEKSIVDIQYAPTFVDLVSMVLVAQGPSERICSLSRSILKHTPSATLNLGNGADWFMAITRLPIRIARRFELELPREAAMEELNLTCHRARSFRSYQWKFYQRILKQDRTWDNDVSAMLSQIRLPPPEDEV
ncbi:MAG: hypothetical protein ACFFAY_01375 [Promethearchaeota archaeon]